MKMKCYLVFGFILCLTAISESREIVRRTLSKDESSGNEEIPLSLNPLENGRRLGLKPAILGPPTVYDDYYDNEVPVLNPDEFGEDRRILKDSDESEVEYTDSKDSKEGNVDKEHKPEEERKTGEEEENGDKGREPEEEVNTDEERVEAEEEEENDDKERIPEEGEKLDGENKEEEEIDDKEHIPEEAENPDEEEKDEGIEEKHVSEGNDENIHDPEEEPVDEDKKVEMPSETEEKTDEHGSDEKEEDVPQDGEEGSLSRGSIFDTPFFNVEQVKKYFGQLERALGHVFRQTMDEAVMLNGTYANTTEEEVDIDGKKYIVTKSLIKGGDNHSSIYVEALSAKPKMNGTEVPT